MRFQRKAQLQWLFSKLPRGEEAYYLLQRHVTHSFPRPDDQFAGKVRRARQHLLKIQAVLRDQDLRGASFLEIGAGWDLIIPLTYWTCGIEEQHLIDFIPRSRLELLNDSIARMEGYGAELEKEWGLTTRPTGDPIANLAEFERRFGIHQHAPMDARRTTLKTDSIDVVTTTSTLEHVFADHLPAILTEWRRVVRPGGIISCHIDLKDHYYGDDSSVSYYNFMKFTPTEWARFNPPLHHQNRLRAPQFIAAFEQAGLEILQAEVDGPTPEDLVTLRNLALDPVFQDFSLEDLGAKILWIVAGNPA